MDIGEIIAISISIAALLLSVFRVAVRVDFVEWWKYRDARRDKQRAEKWADERVRQEQERQRQQEEQKQQRQGDCTHIWEQLTDVNGAGGELSSLPIQYACPLCAAAHDNVAIIDEVNTYYDGEYECVCSYVSKWHSYHPLPRKGLVPPALGEPHSQKCECQTCQRQKAAASAKVDAESPTGGGYDDVDDLPF